MIQIKENFPLKSVCTFAIGGPADFFVLAKSEQEIIEAIKFSHSKNLKPFIYGGGSNLLFPDAGLRTVVIKILNKEIAYNEDLNELEVGAGVSWVELTRFLTKNNPHLYGLESFYGLPGSIGGAVYGNAGCHGLEMKDVLVSVRCYDSNTDEVREILVQNLKMGYRHSDLKNNLNLIVLSAKFKVSKDKLQASGDPVEFAAHRNQSQPKGLTTGSFFKNPVGDYAGRLIEEAGLKGSKVGGIRSSELHANFFINDGTANEKDVLGLKELIQIEVENKFGIELEPEIQFVKSQDWQLT
jgi:UDP-N-acetylmuramate dehydrogenase